MKKPFQVYVEETELARWKQAAEQEGESVSTLVRQAMREQLGGSFDSVLDSLRGLPGA